MSNNIEKTLESYIGKEVKYKGINYIIVDIKNTYSGIKMIFMKDSNEHYFEPSLNLFIDEILNLKHHNYNEFLNEA